MRITKKVLSLLLAFVMLASVSAPAMAYNSEGSEATDANAETPIGQDTLQGHQSEYEKYENADSATTEVYATRESTFKVLIPKTIILSGDGEHIGQYVLQVQGDMVAGDTVSITPQETEIMLNNVNGNKDPIPAAVTQDKDTIAGADVGEDWTTLANGSIAAPGLKAGSWKSTIIFNVSLIEADPMEYEPFTVTMANRAKIGYTDETTDLEIPATFYDEEDNKWYKVTEIGIEAFAFCVNLKSVTIPDTVTSIRYEAFKRSRLEAIVIPDSVTSIEYQAFFECGLKSIEIPDSVTSVDNEVFAACRYLESVTIPESVTTIGDNAFADCTSLQSVTIPESVTTIGDNAFADCTSLQSVTIPESVTFIGDMAFHMVPHIEYHGTATGSPWGAKSIS